MKTEITDVDSYIAQFPPEVQVQLELVRETIRRCAPKASEDIKYGIPTFILDGNLVHYAAYKSHIGFYPAPTGMKSFARELSMYKTGKGSVQFPLDTQMPLSLIRKIVKYRVKENKQKALEKKSKKK